MDKGFGLIVQCWPGTYVGMIQVQKVPKITIIFAATAAFSQK